MTSKKHVDGLGRGKDADKPTIADASSQSERFIAKARELGLDERKKTFDAALTKVARHRDVDRSDPVKDHKDK